MKHLWLFPLALIFSASVVADEPPIKVTVQELLGDPSKYDNQRVEATGYYDCGMEDSYLYQKKAACCDIDKAVYIDPRVWDPELNPHKPKDVFGAQRMKGRIVRVIGTFRSRIVPPGVAATGGGCGPTITGLSYFRPAK
jgi:hypothetical protein